MLFKQAILNGIATGRVTLAFRRWKRPTVRSGGTLLTSVGVLEIRKVEVVGLQRITPEAAKHAGFDSVDDLVDSLGNRKEKLYRIEFRLTGEDPRIALRDDDRLGADDVEELNTRLARLDARSAGGPWTTDVLRLIEANPERRAVELAKRSGIDKERLKVDIRKLKNLGLTESLKVGYRLSPRGRAYLAAVERKGTR